MSKSTEVDERHFEVTRSYRSVACDMLVDTDHSKEACKSCASASNAAKRVARKEIKASTTPAKPKISLTACGPEKLRATVSWDTAASQRSWGSFARASAKNWITRDWDKRKLGEGHSQINGRTNPQKRYLKWQEQIELLQSAKMGRRYHPQVIRFALSLHGKSPSA